MSKFISGPMEFEVEQKEPSRTYNRYRLGNIVGGDLLLDRFELGFLLLNAKSIFSQHNAERRLDDLASLLTEEGDIDRLLVFSKLKSKGQVAKVEKDVIRYRPKDAHNWSGQIVVRNENDPFRHFEASDAAINYSVVDSDGDVTYYNIKRVDLQGRSIESVNERRVKIGSLDLTATVRSDYGLRRKVGHEIVIMPESSEGDLGGTAAEGLALKKRIYSDLISRKLLVRTGFKYGADFRLYTESIEGHAEYLLLISEKGTLRWYDVSRAARIASSVHKQFIIAAELNEKIEYFSVSRVKDILV